MIGNQRFGDWKRKAVALDDIETQLQKIIQRTLSSSLFNLTYGTSAGGRWSKPQLGEMSAYPRGNHQNRTVVNRHRN